MQGVVVTDFLSFTIFGLTLAAVYAVAASGLVVTYTTTGIFNFAHGAIGMICAYAFWQFHVGWKLPLLPSVLIVVLVVAPLLGAGIERLIMRGLEGVSEVIKVVVTIGLMFGLIALAPIIWAPRRGYSAITFFPGSSIQILRVSVSFHQLTAIAVAIAVAAGLRFLLYGTRMGVSMRAVVDNRPLAELNGARPSRASSFSWAVGCSLAAMAGILIQERIGFDPLALTFLVVNAYAAAVVGRLTNLPMTFLGAVLLGLAQSYAQGYIPANPSWVPDGIDITTPVRLAVPVILLFVALLVMPNARLRTQGIQRIRESVPRPTWARALMGFGVLIIAVAIVSRVLGPSDVLGWSRGIAIGIIMLSLVPLTGYGGQISLAQMSIAGIAAFVMAKWGADGSPLVLVLAIVVAAIVGAVVALPALRLRGIYLALGTLAFAYFVEKVVFPQQAFAGTGSVPLQRLRLGPLTFEDSPSYMVFLAVVFSLVGVGVVFLRLGPFGRRLQAMKDSPAACATLGLNLTVTKVQVFALSAAIAGLGGVMYSGVQQTASADDYGALSNLPVLVMAVAGGVAMVSGALVGGLFYAGFTIISQKLPDFEVLGGDGKEVVSDILLLAPALIGISLGRNPNGAVHEISTRWRDATARINARRGAPAGAIDLEALGIDRPFTAEDLVSIDAELGLEDESYAILSTGAGRSWSGAELQTWKVQTGLADRDGDGSGSGPAIPQTAGR